MKMVTRVFLKSSYVRKNSDLLSLIFRNSSNYSLALKYTFFSRQMSMSISDSDDSDYQTDHLLLVPFLNSISNDQISMGLSFTFELETLVWHPITELSRYLILQSFATRLVTL